MFYNELPMLEYRLSLLYDIVDYFVICEANITFMGKPKPFFYLDNKEKFQQYSNKIIHVMLTDENTLWIKNPTNKEPWINENAQRNGIALGIQELENEKKIGNNLNDLIIISDIDEIPNPMFLSHIKQNDNIYKKIINLNGGVNLSMDMYYYNLLTKNTEKWTKTKIIQYHFLKNMKPTEVRLNQFEITIEKGGWHLSYFGDKHFISNKIKNFAHNELNIPEFTNIKRIQYSIENNMDLFERTDIKWIREPLDKNSFLPPNWEFFNYLI